MEVAARAAIYDSQSTERYEMRTLAAYGRQ